MSEKLKNEKYSENIVCKDCPYWGPCMFYIICRFDFELGLFAKVDKNG